MARRRRATGRRGAHPLARLRFDRLAILVIGFLAVLVLLAGAASALERVAYSGKVMRGVNVDGVNVAGARNVAALDRVTRLAADLQQAPLKVRAGQAHYSVSPADVGYNLDVEATARAARAAGRGSNPLEIVAGTVLRTLRDDRVPLRVHLDDARVDALLELWASQIDVGVVEGDLRFEGTTVIPVEPHGGTGLQLDDARAAFTRAFHRADRSHEVSLPVGPVQPRVDAKTVAAAAARARELLSAPFEIDAGTSRTTITPAQLATMLRTEVHGHALDLTLDKNTLRSALGPSIAGFEQPATEATFTVDQNENVHVVPSKDGREIDLDGLARAIVSGERKVVATVRDAHPAHDTAWAQRLGITHKVSSFTTKHPAGQPRVHNIHLAADVLNNTVVEPDEIFSLNEKLGPRTAAKGYVKAPILVEDGFGEDYGGGISQLTTTLFNAVFFGGYEDKEHSPHHFYISRYPMGREATINYPSVDLRFRDDTSHGVLIRTSYSATSITVTLYGDNDGRTVREENRREYNMVAITDNVLTCPVKKPEDDPNNDCAKLVQGEQKKLQDGEVGWDVSFDRVIDQPGKAERRKTYHVHYPMLPNKVLAGSVPPTSTITTPGQIPSSSTTKTTLRHN